MGKIEHNKALIKRCPFLLPRNRRTDEVPENYDYSYTELDAMPYGWRMAFGEQMCREIAEALRKKGMLEKYRVMQIKEKFGFLHWYGGRASREVYNIISKYEQMSKRICIHCGSPATRITTYWISPYCNDCVPEYNGERERTISIDEYFAEIEDEDDD